MKNKDFVVLCLRLLGIYVLILGLSSIPGFIGTIGSTDLMPLFYVLGPMIYVICGLVLMIAAPGIAKFIVNFSEAEEENLQISPSEKTARIAMLILGIYIFTYALPQFIQISIETGLYYKDLDSIPQHLRSQQYRWMVVIEPVIELIIASTLIIGPDKIIGFISRYDTTFKRIKNQSEN